MGESWIVSNLNAALSTWNEKLAEIWSLLTESPQTFKGGQVWGVMTDIHGALQAIGYGLLVLFFAVGVMKTCGSFVEVKKPEHALKLFIRFALAKGAVTYGLELMLAVFSIVQGMVSTIITQSGSSGMSSVSLPQELIDAINNVGFWDSIPLWAVTLIGGLLITVLSFTMILTVYGRMFSLWMNEVDYSTHQETTTIETTDENGNSTTREITETVLVIEFTHKTPDEMASDYHFTTRQNIYLQLLQDPQYEELWADLLGGFAPGEGEVMSPDGTRAPTGTLQWLLPVAGTITSQFGHRVDPITGEVSSHTGTDIACAEGTPILAAADGTVTVAIGLDSWGSSYGYYIQIDHGGGLETLYAHCSSICVTTGQQVQAGKIIGYVGHTGRATGSHLHLEARVDGSRVDAMQYFE